MQALLMYRDREFEPARELPRQAPCLIADLGLDAVIRAMGAQDPFVVGVVHAALLTSVPIDVDTIVYRQEILKDALRQPEPVRELYRLVVESIASRKRPYFGLLSRSPRGILYDSIEVLDAFVSRLRALRMFADAHAERFVSVGLSGLFARIRMELDDAYLARVESHLKAVRFRGGLLVSATLGEGNEGTAYTLREPHAAPQNWLDRLFGKGPPGGTFEIAERDDAGLRALSDLEDRAVNLVTNALAQAADHVLAFFESLRTELAFYVGCLNLHVALAALPAPMTFPTPLPVEAAGLHGVGIYDVGLALRLGHTLVGNEVSADGKALVVITGANQGGKSSLLRAFGLAQLMMHAGMFVGAESFASAVCTRLLTHFRREEDATLERGKLAEELERMSDVTDALRPGAIVLFNESFSSTNEREGSAIATDIVDALTESGIRVFFVTHLHTFARGLFERQRTSDLFLRAERRQDGVRTFRLAPGEPLQTSYGDDLYREVFGEKREGQDPSLPVSESGPGGRLVGTLDRRGSDA